MKIEVDAKTSLVLLERATWPVEDDMNIVRRSAGVGISLVSFLALLLCMAGIAAIWEGKNRLDVVVAELFGTADDAFVFMEVRFDRVTQTLGKSRERVSSLSTRAERLADARTNLAAESKPLLEIVDEVRRELASAEHWLDASQAIAGGVNRVSDTVFLARTGRSGEESGGVTAKKISELSADIVEALARLQLIRRELLAQLDKGVIARDFVVTVVRRVADFEERLANVSARLDEFKQRVSKARASCVELGQRVHWWMTFVSIVLALIVLWFGISQFNMMVCGWRLARGRVGLTC